MYCMLFYYLLTHRQVSTIIFLSNVTWIRKNEHHAINNKNVIVIGMDYNFLTMVKLQLEVKSKKDIWTLDGKNQ